MICKYASFLVSFLMLPGLYAQFDTEGAQVISYFPHIADGGPPTQRWTTSFTLVNQHLTFTAGGTVFLYRDDGGPLTLNFGNGPVSSFDFSVPPQGTVTFTSTAASSATLTGWATILSSLPIQGITQLRLAGSGFTQQAASRAIAAAGEFRSPATASTGFAIANIYNSPVTIAATALAANGTVVAKSSISLGTHGHRYATASQMFSGLPAGFRGTVILGPTAPATYTVALALSTDAGALSIYPASGTGWPVSQFERIWKVWLKVLNVVANTFPQVGANLPKLVIDGTTGQINCFADQAANEVHIFVNFAELISDSESELSFAIAHELGHIIQAYVGLQFVPEIEMDADIYGMLLSLQAGYDPYAAAGALAKLAMASGDAGLVSQSFDNLNLLIGVDLHGSFNNRLALIFAAMQQICSRPEYAGFCATYKGAIHPHLPPMAPLRSLPRQQGSVTAFQK